MRNLEVERTGRVTVRFRHSWGTHYILVDGSLQGSIRREFDGWIGRLDSEPGHLCFETLEHAQDHYRGWFKDATWACA